jgi:UDP-N-acetylmuramoyl-L-alanyl-D-glutamate--2,6-diaminopimelate ligase
VPQVVVADTRVAASRSADAFYDHPSQALTIVGITGTNGKTTTTHLVRDDARGRRDAVRRDRHAGRRRSATTPGPLDQHDAAGARTARAARRDADAGARAVAMEVSSHALALGVSTTCAFAPPR